MFVGYATNHAGDCYEMLNLNTRRILLSRDVLWLGRMYFNRLEESEVHVSIENDSDLQEEEANDEEETKEDSESEEESEETPKSSTVITRSGRSIKAPGRLIEEIEGVTVEEIMAVGAGIGGGFVHTSELIPMKYEEAMSKDEEAWNIAVAKEYERMKKHKVFEAVPKDEMPKDAKVLTSTWAMKQKADGTKRARINARGFEQIPGEHYDETGISSPVVNEASIFIILTLMVMGRMFGELNDVKGAFLNGEFSQGEKLFMKVPKGFEQYYPANVMLIAFEDYLWIEAGSI